jgi:hypothetical protein
MIRFLFAVFVACSCCNSVVLFLLLNYEREYEEKAAAEKERLEREQAEQVKHEEEK